MDHLVPGSKNEIRELQDMVRKLQLQNDQLRSQNLKNGFVDNIQASSLESNANRTDPLDVDDAYCIMDVTNIDFSDDERWLYALPNSSKTRTVDITKWSRQDTDGNVELQLAKRTFMDKIELEQSVRRNIDSRTFTRPKKRVCRPTLGTMVESPLLEDSKFPSMQASWHLTDSMMVGETLDDISNPLNSGSFSIIDLECLKLHTSASQHGEEVDSSAARLNSGPRTPRREELAGRSAAVQETAEVEHPARCDTAGKQALSSSSKSTRNPSAARHRDPGVMNHTFQKMASEPHLHVTSDTRLDSPLARRSDAHSTFTRAANINVNSTFLKSSDPSLDATLVKAADNSAFLLASRSRSLTPSGLNSTFVVQDGASERGLRAAAADSGADDDQTSSASDSSFSSGNKLLNVGDVQNIARMQEESLRQVMSTPFQGRGREVLGSSLGESLPSPIQLRTPGQEGNHDATYHSDHSDSSSLDGGRPRSSRSSRSSPGNSPFGSTQVLAGEVRDSAQLKDRRLVQPARNEYRTTKQVPAARGDGGGVGCLRPPAVSTRGGGRPLSGLPRPAGPRGPSNIPRMQSRIPAPSTIRPARSTQSLRPPVKNAWMDGCY